MGIFDKAENEAENLAQKDPDLAQQEVAARRPGGEAMQAAQNTIGQQGGPQDSIDQNMSGEYQDQNTAARRTVNRTRQRAARTNQQTGTRTRHGSGSQDGYDQNMETRRQNQYGRLVALSLGRPQLLPRRRTRRSGRCSEGAHFLDMPEPLTNIVEAGWADALAPVEDQIARMGAFLREQIAAGKRYLPAGERVLRAFKQPFADVRVLIVGQDPYPTPGHPVGLSFSVDPNVKRLPGTLVNIFREYSAGSRLPDAVERRPDTVDRARRPAAQQGADGRAGQARQPPGQGLGEGHRAGDPRPRQAGHAAGRDLVGPRRQEPGPAARRASRASSPRTQALVREQRLLRDPPVQQRATSCSSARTVASRSKLA